MARDLRLLSYNQNFAETALDAAYRVVEFDGDATPLLVRQNNTFRILVQSGESIAFGAYLNAPAALFPNALLSRPRIGYERVGPKEYKTTWTYEMALTGADSYDFTVHTRWPTSPATSPGFTSLT